MRDVTIETVRERMNELGQRITTRRISLREEFELACLRELLTCIDTESGIFEKLMQHLQDAHNFIENTEAFGRAAGNGILQCGTEVWNIDESKATLRACRAVIGRKKS